MEFHKQKIVKMNLLLNRNRVSVVMKWTQIVISFSTKLGLGRYNWNIYLGIEVADA